MNNKAFIVIVPMIVFLTIFSPVSADLAVPMESDWTVGILSCLLLLILIGVIIGLIIFSLKRLQKKDKDQH